jgi:hypothetical protein
MAESGLSAVIEQKDLGFDPTKLAEMVLRMKEAKRNQATQALQTTMGLAEKGLVEPDVLEKSMKDWQKASGIKLADPKTAQALQAAGKAGAQPSGAQSATPITPEAAKQRPAGGMEPGLKTPSVYETYVKQIRESLTARHSSDLAKSKLEETLTGLKTSALGEGPEAEKARTSLQRVGEMTFNKDLELWTKLTPEEKQKEATSLHEQAMGMETPEKKEQRKSNFITSLVAQGYTPKQAADEFEKPGSSGIKKTFKMMSEEADSFYKLQESFGDEVAAKIAPQLAQGASLSDVLPSIGPYQSHFASQMAETRKQHSETLGMEQKKLDEMIASRKSESSIQSQRLKVEQERLTFEKEMGAERMSNLSDKVDLELSKIENQAFAENFRAYLEAKKAGVAVPKEVEEKYVGELASRVGMKQEEVGNWLSWISFDNIQGRKKIWASDIDKGKKVLDEGLGGASRYAPSPETMEKLKAGMKGKRTSARSKANEVLNWEGLHGRKPTSVKDPWGSK